MRHARARAKLRVVRAMRLPALTTHTEIIDAYAVPQCAAWVPPQWVWDNPHECPWRGRYLRQGTHLCGHHVKMRAPEVL